jgi:hypothetical protein
VATNTTIAVGERSSGGITLSASSVDKVTFAGRATLVEIICDGVEDTFVRLDGVDPTVNGKFAFRFPKGAITRRVLQMPAGSSEVRLISVGTVKYSVGEPR